MKKQERKLIKYADAAQMCETREEAQKILRKHNKARKKIILRRMINE